MAKKRPHAPEKAVVLFSGGMDSLATMAWAINHGTTDVLPVICRLSVPSTPHNNDVEVECALEVLRDPGLPSAIPQLHIPRVLSQSLSEWVIYDEEMNRNWLPGRNLILISRAANLAHAIGYNGVMYGAVAPDCPYPDCTPAFVDAVTSVLWLAYENSSFLVAAPFIEMTKADILTYLHEECAPVWWDLLGKTTSCYAMTGYAGPGRPLFPCETCDSCKKRAEAFEAAGYDDPALR
jgi:7-cyano-7-deazaguanine synthase